uniref:Uncharacterized protein n=1 Tax=Rhizophora mucronata TaxID=61149 RepID=A0A2P2NXN3_RHIMU
MDKIDSFIPFFSFFFF